MSVNYQLLQKKKKQKKGNMRDAIRSFSPYIKHERAKIIIALIVVLINSAGNIVAPYLLAIAVDGYIAEKDPEGLLKVVGVLILIYLVVSVTNYFNIILMGQIGQRVLYKLRSVIFNQIQALPLAFFRQNRSGDLISRINEDTEKVNSLFSETLVRMVANIFTVVGIGIFILVLNWKLGLATLVVSFVALFITRLLTPLTQKVNKQSLDAKGEYSAEVQENLANFKAIIALNRRDYFITQLDAVIDKAYKLLFKARVLNTMTIPLFNLAGNAAQLVILVYGVYLISEGSLTVGLLISFLAYANRFFEPLRILASLWVSIQSALAAWRRIGEILAMESNIAPEKNLRSDTDGGSVLEFRDVSFAYEDGVEVLHHVNFTVPTSKTVAIIGPTGGGKSTIARLAMRLYDVTEGQVFLDGRNIKSYTPGEIADITGYILQEPILFSGTLGENMVYGHPDFVNYDKEKLATVLKKQGLDDLLESFTDGIDFQVDPGNEEMSVGQKQLIAFIRALLREPKLLILDEATANIDTVTEEKIETILQKLPKETSRIVIAHRLNTIRAADDIVFVSNGEAKKAVSFDEAIGMIEHTKRNT
jgi:ATP-binding cassette subfamily B protein